MFCTKCGRPVAEDMAFCVHCGHTTAKGSTAENNAYRQTDTSYAQDETYADIENLVGVNREYYLPKFRQFRQLNKTTSWNWAAFLFPLWWFVYRKMYLYALCAWGVNVLISSMTSGAGGLAVRILAGVFGNYIYMYWLEEQMKQTKIMTPGEKMVFMQKKSGVNKGAVIALVALHVLLVAAGIVIFTVLTARVFTTGHFYIG